MSTSENVTSGTEPSRVPPPPPQEVLFPPKKYSEIYKTNDFAPNKFGVPCARYFLWDLRTKKIGLGGF